LAVVDFPPRPNSEVPAGVRANRRGHGVPPEIVQQEVGAAFGKYRWRGNLARSRKGRGTG